MSTRRRTDRGFTSFKSNSKDIMGRKLMEQSYNRHRAALGRVRATVDNKPPRRLSRLPPRRSYGEHNSDTWKLRSTTRYRERQHREMVEKTAATVEAVRPSIDTLQPQPLPRRTPPSIYSPQRFVDEEHLKNLRSLQRRISTLERPAELRKNSFDTRVYPARIFRHSASIFDGDQSFRAASASHAQRSPRTRRRDRTTSHTESSTHLYSFEGERSPRFVQIRPRARSSQPGRRVRPPLEAASPKWNVDGGRSSSLIMGEPSVLGSVDTVSAFL
eukprot:gnl/Chilomastix_cuspidata/4579.p1 GENE.gnl/Chilomastix_cuspidata/4579~~gnl/Chilomastix_cuspidata/4579.p1  ORF type:complete len:273 (+),score=27.52 gnl/Chilomastix_cuspidata/4579:191-1009(+)